MSDRKALARQLAAVMPGWTYDEQYDAQHEYPGAYLNGPDGARLHVGIDHQASYHTRDTRASISGSYPGDREDVPYGIEQHRIGVSMKRDAAAVAKDIQRRLLPDYLRDLALVQAYKAERERDREVRTAAAEQLAAAFPGGSVTQDRNNRSDRSEVRFYASQHSTYGEMDLRHDGSGITEMKLRGLTIDQALAIGAILSGK